jgi:hypothetical protein
MKKLFLFFLFIFSFQLGYSQYLQLSVYSEVSIVTVGPGENLYETFGHSTIRIKDPLLNFDLAYNYGVFDFSNPNFYSNFAVGKLEYRLARYPFQTFIKHNKQDKRWVKEQVLNLSQSQRQQFFEFLENNARQENASYLYDPYFNNCATKLRDISKIILKDSITLNKEYATGKTLRQLMNDELHWNTWGSFGINLALGTTLDKKATPEQYLYLPDFVFLAFEKGTIKINGLNEPIVKKQNDILVFDEPTLTFDFKSPIIIFSLLMCFGLFMTYRNMKKGKRSKWFDFILFMTTGLIGISIIFLWFFTDHATTPNNFNFLWAFAPNCIVAFYTLKTRLQKGVKKYLFLLLLFLGLMIIIWGLGIQLFSLSMIPLIVLFGVRYYYLLSSKE